MFTIGTREPAARRATATDTVWATLLRYSFAVLSHATPGGAPRSSGVLYTMADETMYVAVAADSWKARHIAADDRVAVTVPVRRGGLLSPDPRRPPCTARRPAPARSTPPTHPAVSATSSSRRASWSTHGPTTRARHRVPVRGRLRRRQRRTRAHLVRAVRAYPQGVTPVPLPVPPPSTGDKSCTVSVPVPSLASGQTYWVQFTTHADGQISSTWQRPVPQSAQLLLYPGNPFVGLTDPVATGAKGGAIAKQVTSNTTSFSVNTAPTTETAGTYTVQFFNASNAFGATTATINYVNDAGTACAASPLVGHVIN